MKTVRTMVLVNLSKEFEEKLSELMRRFCSCKRYAFNRLLEGKSANDLNKILPTIFHLNKRYTEDAVLLASGIITSQKELLPARLEDVQAKIAKTERKIVLYQTGKRKPKKTNIETCLKGLNARLEKLRKKELKLVRCVEENTIPPVIFGGKKKFFKRMSGDITNTEWKELRSNELYSRGDKSKKGNLNLRVAYDENVNKFFLEIANPVNTEERISPRIRCEVSIPDKFFNEILDIIFPDKDGFQQPYTIQILRKSGSFYVNLIYEEVVYGNELRSKDQLVVGDKLAGIDVNIDRIAVTILTKPGNFLKSKVFYYHEMEYVSSHRRSNIAGVVAKEVIDYLLAENIGAIVLEDITLRQQHDTNKKFNRLTHSFAKKKLMEALIRRGLRNGFQIKKVNPAYTSVIGRFKYSQKLGISVHEAASYVIGRRGLGFEERLSKEVIRLLKEQVKPHLIKLLASMEESEKKSVRGKKQRKYFGMLLNIIEHFKELHRWKVWNVVHKTLRLINGEPLLITR